MPSDGPESLLKSALEKVVFFECRIEQLEADVRHATAERDHLEQELSQGAARELDLKQELTALQSRYLTTRRELDAQQGQVQSLRAERERWLTTLADATRIRQAGELPQGDFDLASFIAELRAEVEALRTGQPRDRVPPAPAPRDASEVGAGMAMQGRLGFSERDRKALVSTARFETRAEETVFAFSLRELSSPHADSRARAAERLGALESREAAAALAAALNVEPDAQVKPALIEALAKTGGEEALPLLYGHLRDGDVPVRLAALEAAVKLGGVQSAHELDRALSDSSPRVRRRATLLAGSLGAMVGGPLLAHASADSDPSVRRVAVLSLAALGGEVARRALSVAGDDDDLGVRRAAWQALARLFGEPLLGMADEPAVRRRRELRRLEGETFRPVAMAKVAQAALGKAGSRQPPAPEPEPAPPRAEIHAALSSQVLAEVASSLRGRSLEELSALGEEPLVARAAAVLMGEGRLVRRNQRFFLA